jgi:transcriptional regulator with XRE-family HTH domain
VNQVRINKHLGGVIRDRRKKLGLKQHQLAARLGISRGSLANIEIGNQGMLVHQLYKFARALDLSPADFLMPLSEAMSLVEDGWSEVIPPHLKQVHRAQIAQLLGSEPAATKGEMSAKPQKK